MELVKNIVLRVGEIDLFESWDEIDVIVFELEFIHGVLVEFLVGMGVCFEEVFGVDWVEIELWNGIFMVQCVYVKGWLKHYVKIE